MDEKIKVLVVDDSAIVRYAGKKFPDPRHGSEWVLPWILCSDKIVN